MALNRWTGLVGMERRDDPENWVFDVTLARRGAFRSSAAKHRSRVIISRSEYPNWVVASEVAAQLAAAVHRSSPVRVDPVY
jgi:hypothetical protein